MNTICTIALLSLAALLTACVSTPGTSRHNTISLNGSWRATLDGKYHIDIEFDNGTISLTDGDVQNDIVVYPHTTSFDGTTFSMTFDHSPFMPAHISPPTPGHGDFTMTAAVTGNTMTGTGTRADGKAFTWTGERFD